ncbi:carbohydrate ABC transporter permease [Caldalkalibacillus salinus]|uniref:carbohydrate ABC transporter permease n=1 Tax=Caldalkalibacillus salinus TaxID=2803787 RepID=UPI0019247660|nr:sugar ABC transporter permease [Caldalkalibacillus salinus]
MKKADQRAGVLFILPALLVLLTVVLYPIIHTLYLSLQSKILIAPQRDQFVGIQNYMNVLSDPEMLSYVWITVVFTVSSVVLKLILGLCGALLLNVKRKGTKVYWSIFMIPWLIPSVVAALIWRWMLHDQFGIVNHVLLQVGLIEHRIAWLSDQALALLSVIIVDAWVGIPFMIVVLLAGLNTIPREWYEAAMVDGANAWQRLIYITLPGLRPMLLVMGTLSFIGTFNSFNIIYTMTGGGPVGSTRTLIIHTHQLAFTEYDFGLAATVSVLTLIFILISTYTYRRKLVQEGGKAS